MAWYGYRAFFMSKINPTGGYFLWDFYVLLNLGGQYETNRFRME